MEKNLVVPQKVKYSDSKILLLDIYPREMKTGILTKTCTWILTVTLFPTAQKKKQHKCPAIDEWITKWGTPYNGILCSYKMDTCYNMDEPWKHYAK